MESAYNCINFPTSKKILCFFKYAVRISIWYIRIPFLTFSKLTCSCIIVIWININCLSIYLIVVYIVLNIVISPTTSCCCFFCIISLKIFKIIIILCVRIIIIICFILNFVTNATHTISYKINKIIFLH